MTNLFVIEDNQADRDQIAYLAKACHDLNVSSVETGVEALETLRLREPDCILLDYRLGAGEDGFEVLAQVKAILPFCPVIMLTGVGNEATAVAAMNAGAADYLVKGDLSAVQLDKAVAQAISRAQLERTVADQADILKRTDRLDAVGQLAAGIAHDFNNILATVRYAVHLMASAAHDEKSVSYGAIASDAIDRGGKLATRLLSFSRQGPGAVSARATSDVLEALLRIVAPTLDERVTLVPQNAAPGLGIQCDQSQLDAALLNLVLNAEDAIQQSGIGDTTTVRLSRWEDPTQTDGIWVEVTVIDNGPGMTDDVRQRCTDPFFTTKSGTAGSGLGLSIVYGFIQQCDGQLSIMSKPGEGCSVRMRLPAVPNVPERKSSSMLPNPLPGRTVLAVEDELEQLDMLYQALSNFGYEVIRASTMAEALRHAAGTGSYDVLLTDVRLPDGTGMELAAQLRAQNPTLPVVYVSGYIGDAEEMAVAGAAMIPKPCDPGELVRAIEAEFETND